jgi:type II secretion system protein N
MNPKLKKALIWAGYAAGYLVALLFFMYFTFPYERLKQRVVSAYNSSQNGPNSSRMDIEDLTWSFRFPGLVAEGIRLIGPEPPPAPEGEEPTPQQVVRVDEVYARASIFSLLAGNLSVSFAAEAFGGTLDGSLESSDEGQSLHVELEGVQPGEVPELAKAVGVPLEGALTGRIDMQLPEGKLSKANGEIELEIVELLVSDGKAKIRNMLALPQIQAGSLTLKASVKAGRLKIDEFKGRGPDLEVDAEGRLKFRDNLGTSTAELDLRFKFTDNYRGKSDVTKALLGEPGSSSGGLFDSLDPKVKRAKGADGGYTWHVAGLLDNLRFTPSTKRLGSGEGAPDAPAPAATGRTRRPPTSVPSPRQPPSPPPSQRPPPSGAGVVLPEGAYQDQPTGAPPSAEPSPTAAEPEAEPEE